MNGDVRKKICLALDVDSMDAAVRLVSLLKDYVGIFKIRKQLFTRYGPLIVKNVIDAGGAVFLDLKFHDIPNTAALAAAEALNLRVKMFNVHASGGLIMMEKAFQAVESASGKSGIARPLILAVTVLTSINESILKEEIRCRTSVKSQVIHLAMLAKQAGLDGVVASPLEIKAIRKKCGKDFIILTPGIRPSWAGSNDQKRIMTPKEALKAGADYIVIGRPVTAHPDPVQAAKMVLEEISCL